VNATVYEQFGFGYRIVAVVVVQLKLVGHKLQQGVQEGSWGKQAPSGSISQKEEMDSPIAICVEKNSRHPAIQQIF
jgi:hypothetical protein